MSTHAEHYWRESKGLLTLWAGVLLGPTAWALNLQTNYTLSAFACEGAWPLVLHAVSLATLVMSGAGFWIAWRSWQALRDPGQTEGPRSHRIERSRFMAAGGILLSAYFGLTIFAQWLPTFLVPPCVY
jgi:hypothetical protein